MKHIKKALLPATMLCGALAMAAGPALADREHGYGYRHGGPRVHFGVTIGEPVWPRYYYPSPFPYYYPPTVYYPPPVVVQSQPPVYVEQRQAPAASEPADAYWYYCEDAKAYYPYVKSCSGGWQRVAPQPQ